MGRSELADQQLSVWTDILDALEADLARGVDVDQIESWAAPTDAGPIPEELVDRARTVLEAQHRLAAELTLERETVGRHLAALRTVPSVQNTDRSVYLDTLG